MKARVCFWLCAIILTINLSHAADSRSPLAGRWDLTVKNGAEEFPSWLEVERSGSRTLVGHYVGQFGSARPISKIETSTEGFRFVVPPQWEKTSNDIVVTGKLEGEILRGQVVGEGGTLAFEGRRAPTLVREKPPTWGAPIKLFNGRDLTGWKPRNPKTPNGWEVKDGVLINAKPGIDLLSEQKFEDFKLRAVFRYPKGSNSGIYLRGRYEAQIEDNHGRPPGSHYIGGIYGFLTPRVNASKPAGEWQTMEITLVGRELTLVLNGEAVIERQAIPGITGGALDSNEGAPGPMMLQGDHGVVEFKELTVTPAK